jgi:hypothetical protein
VLPTPNLEEDRMSNQVWKIMRALAGVEHGSDCRSCGESIHRRDSFGRSERVCTPCRDA